MGLRARWGSLSRRVHLAMAGAAALVIVTAVAVAALAATVEAPRRDFGGVAEQAITAEADVPSAPTVAAIPPTTAAPPAPAADAPAAPTDGGAAASGGESAAVGGASSASGCPSSYSDVCSGTSVPPPPLSEIAQRVAETGSAWPGGFPPPIDPTTAVSVQVVPPPTVPPLVILPAQPEDPPVDESVPAP